MKSESSSRLLRSSDVFQTPVVSLVMRFYKSSMVASSLEVDIMPVSVEADADVFKPLLLQDRVL